MNSAPSGRRPLTVIVPCKNERRNIRACIASFAEIADEILIADSGSTDGTLQIVRDIGGCRIIEREYVHSGDFKNWAMQHASHDWVLIVDADERVTPELAREIRAVLSGPDRADGYWIYRENYFMGHRVRFSGWQSDRCLRLFRRSCGRYVGDTDHAEVSISTGRVGRLRHRLRHYSYWSYDAFFQKFNRYTSWQAQVWHAAGRRPNYWRMLFTVPTRFLWLYIVRLGFLDGYVGLQICTLSAFYSFMKRARLWELTSGLPQPDPETSSASPGPLRSDPGRCAA
ncbi:MAG: glycosyltransferase family 2 protein [Planctomycetota bacterium]|nr:MAG: glycosyltransferase family 2 protein [Planctomycetota bacterium]